MATPGNPKRAARLCVSCCAVGCFEGLKTHFQAGNSSEGGRDTWEGSVAYGTPIGERAHLL